MSFDVMTKYGMCVAPLNKVSEHVRTCPEFRAKREIDKDKTVQVTKENYITSFKFFLFEFLQLVAFFLLAISRTRQEDLKHA